MKYYEIPFFTVYLFQTSSANQEYMKQVFG